MAGPIFAGREGSAIRLRAGESVVTSWRVADAGDHGAPFRQRGLHVQLVVVAVKIVNVLRDNLTFEILPWAGADAIACINGRLTLCGLGTQISPPSLATSTGPLRHLLTISIRSLDATKVDLCPDPRP